MTIKKILVSVSVIVAILILAACSSSTLSFSEIENVPNNVQDRVDSNLKLQLINDGEKGSYIIFYSSGDVDTDFITQGKTVTIKINEINSEEDGVKQHTFYLTTEPEHDVIEVLVNGESTPFDNVTSV